MQNGQIDGNSYFGIDLFYEDDGFATETLLLALLLCVTLVFSTSVSMWAAGRSSDVQQVADAAALSAAKTVSLYVGITQIIDALALSLGLTGLVSLAMGFVVCCMPLIQGAGTSLVDIGLKVLKARSDFLKTMISQLKYLESCMPFLMVGSSVRVVVANTTNTIEYKGLALPFPLKGESDFGAIGETLDEESIRQVADSMSTTSQELKELYERRKDSKMEGWLADCGGSEQSLYERTSALSEVNTQDNPLYENVDDWNFGVPLKRARAYYADRSYHEKPLSDIPEEHTRSRCRAEFYDYALSELKHSYYIESSQSVDMDLAELPYDTPHVMQTDLYRRQVWWLEEDAGVLHSYKECPGVTGDLKLTSLEEADDKEAHSCEICSMSTSAQGKVASATSRTPHGFEYWWKKIVEASKRYQQTQKDIEHKEIALKEDAGVSETLFEKATQALHIRRPHIVPPGAYGCVALVIRTSDIKLPSKLVQSFLKERNLPKGVAISGAVLAPDASNNSLKVATNFITGIEKSIGSGSVISYVTDLWESLLDAYGDGIQTIVDGLHELPFGLSNTALGRAVLEKFKSILNMLDIQPTDIRTYKPTLVSSEVILNNAGFDMQQIREVIQRLPDTNDVSLLVKEVFNIVLEEYKEKVFSIANIYIAGLFEIPEVAVELEQP